MTPYFNSVNPLYLSGTDLDKLLALGWYRMHQSIFTCSHLELDTLYRVHWLRFKVPEIKESSTHRRIRKKNSQFNFVIEDFTEISPAHAELHKHYRASIDFDGAWSIHECLFGNETGERNIYRTKCISIYDGLLLIAAGYFDVGDNSAASILHFYHPQYAPYSLGKYLILLTIDYLREHAYDLYYPGYVVQGHRKMDYKLFLGKSKAFYFSPEEITWKQFDEQILIGDQQ